MTDTDNIRINLLMEDPNMGEGGKQFHKQFEMSQYRLDESSVPERDQLELAMRKMAEAVADEWEQRHTRD